MGTIIKKSYIVAAALTVLIIFTLLFYNIFIMNDIYIVATNSVPIYSTLEEARANPAPVAMAYLMPGQRVKVVKCIDVKAYQMYKVSIPDDKLGFILDGQYHLVDRKGNRVAC